jgi:hypothetical protein
MELLVCFNIVLKMIEHNSYGFNKTWLKILQAKIKVNLLIIITAPFLLIEKKSCFFGDLISCVEQVYLNF